MCGLRTAGLPWAVHQFAGPHLPTGSSRGSSRASRTFGDSSCGEWVSTIVRDLCVLGRQDTRFVVTALLPAAGDDVEAAIALIRRARAGRSRSRTTSPGSHRQPRRRSSCCGLRPRPGVPPGPARLWSQHRVVSRKSVGCSRRRRRRHGGGVDHNLGAPSSRDCEQCMRPALGPCAEGGSGRRRISTPGHVASVGGQITRVTLPGRPTTQVERVIAIWTHTRSSMPTDGYAYVCKSDVLEKGVARRSRWRACRSRWS